MTYDLKENDVEKELTIYLSQYIYEMYSEYLNKKRMEKNTAVPDPNNMAGAMAVDPQEETKNEKGNLRTGDKYIIRKLVSLKIMPEQIQDFISLVASGVSNNSMGMNGFQMNTNNLAPNYTENQLQPPQFGGHMRSNS